MTWIYWLITEQENCLIAFTLNLLRVLAHTSWGADQETLLHLYRSLIRSKLDYGCIVYGSARGSYFRMLDPIQNHALRLCLGAYRTSPASSLCMEANEPPLYFRRKKLSLQYCLKLSSNYNNPAYATVFNSKFHSVFERKPTQLPPLAMRVSGDLQAVGLKKVMLLHLLYHPHLDNCIVCWWLRDWIHITNPLKGEDFLYKLTHEASIKWRVTPSQLAKPEQIYDF